MQAAYPFPRKLPYPFPRKPPFRFAMAVLFNPAMFLIAINVTLGISTQERVLVKITLIIALLKDIR